MWSRSHKVSAGLTALAFANLAAAAVWMSQLRLDDWDILIPLYMIMFVTGPLSGLGLIMAAAGASAAHRARTAYLVLANLAMLAGPWIWFSFAD